MEDSTEEDLDDEDYVEPAKPKVLKGARRRKSATSGNRGEPALVLEMNSFINQAL